MAFVNIMVLNLDIPKAQRSEHTYTECVMHFRKRTHLLLRFVAHS